jgi:DNA-binding NtrC family response regulator
MSDAGSPPISLPQAIRICLIEHEQTIYDLLKWTLEDAGYDVVGAHTGEDAISLIDGRINECGALVCDVSLPSTDSGVDSWELSHRARELAPELAIIYMHADFPVRLVRPAVPGSMMLRKPFKLSRLVQALSDLLSNGRLPPREA